MIRRQTALLFIFLMSSGLIVFLNFGVKPHVPSAAAAPSQSAMAALQAAASPDVCFDFESGSLPTSFTPETTTNGSASGRVEVVNQSFLNINGSFTLRLDTNCATTDHASCIIGDNTRQAAVMETDLGGVSDIALSFKVKRIFDDLDPEDGVFFSDDLGASYEKIFDFQSVPADYQNATSVFLDISALAITHGIEPDDGFLIKFQAVDDEMMFDSPYLYDGYGLDDICICTAPAVPDVATALVGDDLVVSWNDTGVPQYEVWSAVNDFSFTPGNDCSNPGPGQSCAVTSSTSYTLTNVLVHPDFSYNVAVRSVNICGQSSADGTGAVSNNQMMFTFPLTDTFPADLAVDLSVSESAASLDILSYTSHPLTYTVNYTNESGSYSASNPVLTYTLDITGVLDSGASSAGWSQVGSQSVYTMPLAPLGPGVTGTATLVMNVDGSTAQLTTPQVEIGDLAGGDPYTPNSTATAATTLNVSADSDSDGLPDWVETGTNTYSSPLNTGTDPNLADTDGDGINDGDEVRGTTAGLLLAEMGVNPLQKNILLEYDWFDDANECSAHSHRPTAAAIAEITAVFNSAPVSNPDGSAGIVLINDYGQGGAFTGGNLIEDSDGVINGGVNGPDFGLLKSSHFDNRRSGYFHYVLMPHRYDTNSNSSGQAELTGDDMIVSLYCANSDHNVAHTVVHELGHNLSLLHGGNDNFNYKPNYNSVMNYKYQFPGVDNDCDSLGDGVLNLSQGFNISLDETNLDEAAGVCGVGEGVSIDWNNNSIPNESGVSADINNIDGQLSTLNDFNDWANIAFSGISDGDGASLLPPIIITEQPVPPEYQD